MTVPYVAPGFPLGSFNCPICGAFAKQDWGNLYKFSSYSDNPPQTVTLTRDVKLSVFLGTKCAACGEYSIWLNGKLIYPFGGTAPLPNPDLPDDVKQDYLEARDVMAISPRGAAALLRLAIQRLCIHLGGKGKNINDDIAALVKKGLPLKLQQALDSVRVIGNNAVHPGTIDIHDNVGIVNSLFVFINIICDNQITQPKQIEEYYQTNIPQNLREAINNRDK